MSYQSIIFEIADGIGRLTFNRPDRLNSFTTAMHDEVRVALGRLLPEGARVLVLSGAGRAFCAGQDLNDRAVAPGGRPVDLGDSIERYYKPLVRRSPAKGFADCANRSRARLAAVHHSCRLLVACGQKTCRRDALLCIRDRLTQARACPCQAANSVALPPASWCDERTRASSRNFRDDTRGRHSNSHNRRSAIGWDDSPAAHLRAGNRGAKST